MPLFIKLFIPFLVLMFIHFFYLNGKKLIKNQNLYRLEKVSFVGLEKSDPYEIIEALELEKGMNLLFVDIDELNDKIKSIPRYESAEVILRYPSTIVLKLKEKKPKFMIKLNETMFSVNRWGEVTERTNEVKEYDLFFIESKGFQDINELLKHEKFKQFIQFAKEVPEKEQDIFEIFSGISLNKQDKDWILYGHNHNTKFNIGKEITLVKIRKTRYAYLYALQRKLSTKNVFVTDDLVHYNL